MQNFIRKHLFRIIRCKSEPLTRNVFAVRWKQPTVRKDVSIISKKATAPKKTSLKNRKWKVSLGGESYESNVPQDSPNVHEILKRFPRETKVNESPPEQFPEISRPAEVHCELVEWERDTSVCNAKSVSTIESENSLATSLHIKRREKRDSCQYCEVWQFDSGLSRI